MTLKKILDVSVEFTDFTGEKIKWEVFPNQKVSEQSNAVLKHVLLRVISTANNSDVNISDEEKIHVYEAGRLIGSSLERVELTQQQYDVVKKLVDNGKVKNPQGGSIDILGLVLQQQCKKLVDSAETEKVGSEKIEEK